MCADIYVASEGPCTHKELSGKLHLCTVSLTHDKNISDVHILHVFLILFNQLKEQEGQT